jgi:hypothetical protein
VARSLHRTGGRWRKAKSQMHAMYGYVCLHCGHSEAGEADHLTPLMLDPDQPIDPTLMRPSHGSNYPCPVCPGRGGKGRACNQERGVRPLTSAFVPAIDW